MKAKHSPCIHHLFLKIHTHTHSNSYIHTQKGREWVIIISVWEKGEGADGFYLRCDGSSTVNKRERGMGV